MRISRRKTQPAIRLRAARERRHARLYKHAALESIYNGLSHYSWEMKKVAGAYRKFYKGPYEHTNANTA